MMIVIPSVLLCLACLSLASTPLDGVAESQQNATPSMLARQIEKEEEKLREAFERDLGSLRAQPEDWEERLRPLIKRSADMLSQFRLKDWQGKELFALSLVSFFAEEWALAIEGFRAFLAEPGGDGRGGDRQIRNQVADARFRVVRSLIELKRIEEAAAALAELDRMDTSSPVFLGARVYLHRDLAVAYRDTGDLQKAVRQAIAGFELGRRISPRAELSDQVREARDFETGRLAAMAVALLERLDQRKAADELQRRWRLTGRGRPAQAEAIYDQELAVQRLIGLPSPEVEARVWIDPPPLTSNALRGKVVLLYFWAMWNSSSTSQFARLKKWQSDYEARGFQVVGVTRLFGRSEREAGLTADAELKSLQGFRTREGIGFPFAVGGQDDPTNDERFNATVLPMFVLIDRDGRICRIDRGVPVRRYRGLGDEIERLTARR